MKNIEMKKKEIGLRVIQRSRKAENRRKTLNSREQTSSFYSMVSTDARLI